MVFNMPPEQPNRYPPSKDFESAANGVLAFLQQRIGMGLWMVTRTQSDDWIVLQAADYDYGIKPGQVLRWSDSFCSRMVRGEGPRIAADAQGVPSYAESGVNRQLVIGAYVGVPLTQPDGSLFGTICGISPNPQPQTIEQEQPLVELLAQLLSTVVSQELLATGANRRAETAHAEAMRDGLTGLFNRRGFDDLMNAEEKRCIRYGHVACVIAVDLNGLKIVNDHLGHHAGDDMIRRAAEVLNNTARQSDILARVGGDEFVILAVECDENCGHDLAARVQHNLADVGVRAAVGMAPRRHGMGLKHACIVADAAMYENKRAQRVVA